jgi:ribosome maturation factor RimP
MARSELSKTIEPRLAELAEEFSFEFVDAEIVKEGASRYFRIYIDKPGGITLNDCESYHRRVIPLVEQIDYDFLEVCSPGLDRPLKKEKDFLAHIGDTVEVHLYRPRDGRKVFEGVLSKFENDTLTIAAAGSEESFTLKEVSLCKPVIVITEEDLNGTIVDLIPDGTTEV